jgi:hypothetical protein
MQNVKISFIGQRDFDVAWYSATNNRFLFKVKVQVNVNNVCQKLFTKSLLIFIFELLQLYFIL